MISVAYMTNRKDCRIEWFLASLNRQMAEMPEDANHVCDVIIIDYYGRKEFEAMRSRYTALPPIRVFKPKPCVWQGEFKKTSKDYFAASNARNTAMIAAQGDYLVFVDDVSVLNPGWLRAVLHAQKSNHIVFGRYQKVKELTVCHETGKVEHISDFQAGIDARYKVAPSGMSSAPCDWLYGCSFGCPITLLELVNGFDEACDGMGYEDYHLGYRLRHAAPSAVMSYDVNMFTYESEELHHTNEVFLRIDKKTPGNPLGHDASHVVLNTLRGTNQVKSKGNNFDLAEARAKFKANGEFPKLPSTEVHWIDGQPLGEM